MFSRAEISSALLRGRSVRDLRKEAAIVEKQFLVDVGQRLDEVIRELASQNSPVVDPALVRILFLAYPAFLLYRVGKEFFLRQLLSRSAAPDDRLLYSRGRVPRPVDDGLVMLFVHRLQRGLKGRVVNLAQELVDLHLSQGLFPHVEEGCREAAPAGGGDRAARRPGNATARRHRRGLAARFAEDRGLRLGSRNRRLGVQTIGSG
ncbi:MAG: hypothetical protein QM820_43240 [Minicystis sp.]